MKNISFSVHNISKKPVEGKTFDPKLSSKAVHTSSHLTFNVTSPKNFNFFGKHKSFIPKEIIHSSPTTPQLKINSPLQYPAAFIKSKTILENNLYLVENDETFPSAITENQIIESGKYKNLETLLQEKGLFTISDKMNNKVIRLLRSNNPNILGSKKRD